MSLRSLLLTSFVVATSSQATAPPGGCLVCGDGKVVTNPEAIFIFPGQPSVDCATLQVAGTQGLIPLDNCAFLPSVITICECETGGLPGDPTPAPVVPPTPVPIQPPTPAPVVPPTPVPVQPPTPVPVQPPTPPPGGPLPCPSVPDGGCSVCGEGLCVTLPDNIFMFPGQPSAPCSVLQGAGYTGLIPMEQCPFLPSLTEDICGCMTSIPAPPTPQPILPPTLPPTPPPFTPPTPPPFIPPTPPPFTPPTAAPLPPSPILVMTPAPIVTFSPNPFFDGGGMGGDGMMGMDGGMGMGGSPDGGMGMGGSSDGGMGMGGGDDDDDGDSSDNSFSSDDKDQMMGMGMRRAAAALRQKHVVATVHYKYSGGKKEPLIRGL